MQGGGRLGKDALARLPARHLPRAMLGRTKTVFQVPMQRWLSHHRNGGNGGKDQVPERVAAIRQWAHTVASAR
jgi:hypothetical protein